MCDLVMEASVIGQLMTLVKSLQLELKNSKWSHIVYKNLGHRFTSYLSQLKLTLKK